MGKSRHKELISGLGFKPGSLAYKCALSAPVLPPVGNTFPEDVIVPGDGQEGFPGRVEGTDRSPCCERTWNSEGLMEFSAANGRLGCWKGRRDQMLRSLGGLFSTHSASRENWGVWGREGHK